MLKVPRETNRFIVAFLSFRGVYMQAWRPFHSFVITLLFSTGFIFSISVKAAEEQLPYCHRYADLNFPDYMALWDEDEPALTASAFFAMLNMAAASADKTFFSELLSQIARTFVLRQQFDEANFYLDQASQYLEHAQPRAKVYYWREKARLMAYQKDTQAAAWLLEKAWQEARQHGYDQVAIETALDLSGVAFTRLPEKDRSEWKQRARQLAKTTDDNRARRWLAAHQERLSI